MIDKEDTLAVRIWFHLEPTENGRVVWWAESPDEPSVYASGDSLADTRLTAERIIRDLRSDTGEAVLEFEYDILHDPPAESPLSPSDWDQLSAVAS